MAVFKCKMYGGALELNENLSVGACPYCGGEFKGLFGKKCSKCGKSKDY